MHCGLRADSAAYNRLPRETRSRSYSTSGFCTRLHCALKIAPENLPNDLNLRSNIVCPLGIKSLMKNLSMHGFGPWQHQTVRQRQHANGRPDSPTAFRPCRGTPSAETADGMRVTGKCQEGSREGCASDTERRIGLPPRAIRGDLAPTPAQLAPPEFALCVNGAQY